jgi:hypothetical protein
MIAASALLFSHLQALDCRRHALKPRPLAEPKGILEPKKPLCVRYEEVVTLRQAILEAQTTKPLREDRLTPE